ncbi:MAG: DUF1080 domain-containing protein [Planctomycetaceae bacterium]|nr:DUF1080 domain-containing protein [Planctomycetaceae bacterium]
MLLCLPPSVAGQRDEAAAGSAPSRDQTRPLSHVADGNADGRLDRTERQALQRLQLRVEQDRAQLPVGTRMFENMAYVPDGHPRHTLDLYLPADTNPRERIPLIIWIHGGGWQKGSKDLIARNSFVLKHGFALASINYRLTSDAVFPAQIHDCKAAIRYLRKHARSFGIDAERFGVWGASAGGHLAALVGTSGEVSELEGSLGEQKFGSKVQAVCDYFGPTDMITMGEHVRTKPGQNQPPETWPETKLLGGRIADHPERARAASPATYVSPTDPPFLFVHGDQDPLVPLNQSESLRQKLKSAGVAADLIVVEGAGHGFFKQPEIHDQVVAFFKQHLQSPSPPPPDSPTHVAHSDAGTIAAYVGKWAVKLPGGSAAWLHLYENLGGLSGEMWTVGAPSSPFPEIAFEGQALCFSQQRAVGDPEYPGGPYTGKKRLTKHKASVDQDRMTITLTRPKPDGTLQEQTFFARRIAPLPDKPDLSRLNFGPAVSLFNGRDLTGWKLTNPQQTSCWKVVDGVLWNDTPKTSFSPYAKYGNLRTEAEFDDFQLSLEFNVPSGGNSGVYLKGRYEVQVVDRDSRMQGTHGVGAVFNRILPMGMHGRGGGEWQSYNITLVDRHITVVLNGITVIDNQPLEGCTNGALNADDSLPGPVYLQGDHTSVRYRNIQLKPLIRH